MNYPTEMITEAEHIAAAAQLKEQTVEEVLKRRAHMIDADSIFPPEERNPALRTHAYISAAAPYPGGRELLAYIAVPVAVLESAPEVLHTFALVSLRHTLRQMALEYLSGERKL